jgi:hypothetical protein
MGFIDRESNVTLSGDITIGAVEIEDHDSGVRADVTEAGLNIDDWTRDVIGEGVQIQIVGSGSRLDCTPLVGGIGYPMRLELEARGAPCYIKQGDAAVVLGNVPSRMLADEWRIVTVSGEEEAYFMNQRESTTVSGTLVIVRIDNM